MPCHHDRRMTKPVARRPLRPSGYNGMGPSATLPLLDRWPASTSSWRLASSPMALVTRPYRLPPRAPLTVVTQLALLLMVTVASATPAVEYFTEVEIDQIRDTQDIGERTAVFLDIAKTRLIYLGLEEAPKKKGEGKATKVVKTLINIFQPGATAQVDQEQANEAEAAEESDAELVEFSSAELLRGYYQALEEAMDNIDDAYERKRGNVRKPLEALKEFTVGSIPALKKFDTETDGENAALSDAIEQAELALDGAKAALKTIPKTAGN